MPITASRPAPLAAGLLLLLALPAQAIEYDGNWRFSMACAASGGLAGFSDSFTAPITQNAFTRSRGSRNAAGVDETSRATGRIENNQMTVVLDRSRGTERWSVRFAGPASSERRFDLAGGLFVGDRQLRSCQMVAEAITSAPGSLAATAPARAAATRQQLADTTAQLAAAQAALAELQRSSEARADALRTELDLARFEGAAMRAELTQRAAATAAATAAAAAAQAQSQQALTAANARATTAQAALTQAVAGATAMRAELEGRIRAAEGATAQARAQVGTLQAEVQTRQRVIEAATAQVGTLQAEAQARQRAIEAATAQGTQLEARLRAAEAATAQAQRELAEARAAQPPR